MECGRELFLMQAGNLPGTEDSPPQTTTAAEQNEVHNVKPLKSQSAVDLTLIIIGGMFVGAKGIVLTQFVLGNILFEFWTFRWIVSLLLTWGLFMAGIGLLNWGGGRPVAERLTLLFGLLYWAASLFFYVYLSYQQIWRGLPLESFTGLLLLFIVCAGTGFGCILAVNARALRQAAYFYGFASLLIVLLIIHKYLFQNTEGAAGVFLVETLLFFIGALMFIGLLVFSRQVRAP